MDRDERIRVQDRILVLTLFVQTLVLVSQVLTISIYAQQSFQASMVPTVSGEALQVHISTDTGRPKGTMDRVLAVMRDIRSSFSGTWIGSYFVGGVERENATVSISITVTGSNVASTAAVDYYVEARSGEASYRFLNATGQSATVGGSALQASDRRSIEGHLQAMGLSTTQSQTVDYYVYVKAVATGAVSGEPLTSEIAETKFDTKTYQYGTEATLSGKPVNANEDYRLVTGDSWSSTATYHRTLSDRVAGFLAYPSGTPSYFDIPQGATITNAYISFKAYTSVGSGPGCDVTIRAEKRGLTSAQECAGIVDWNSRVRTTSQLTWSITQAWTSSTRYNSPDIKNIIQEVVNEATWTSSQRCVQIFLEDQTGTSGNYRAYRTRDSDALDPPYLYITFVSYSASWYPLPPMSLASLPITLDVVAWAALIVATALAWRENRRKMK